MAQFAAVVPESAVKPVAGIRDAVFPLSPGEAADHRDHLIMGYTVFIDELIVADAGVGISSPHNPVEDVFSVRSLVQGQVIFLKLIRQGRQGNGIDPLAKHGQHADAPGRKFHLLPGCQPLPEQGHKIIQLGKNFSGFHNFPL